MKIKIDADVISAINSNHIHELRDLCKKLMPGELTSAFLYAIRSGHEDACLCLANSGVFCNARYNFVRVWTENIHLEHSPSLAKSSAICDLFIRKYFDVVSILVEMGNEIKLDEISHDVIYEVLHACDLEWKVNIIDKNDSFKKLSKECIEKIAVLSVKNNDSELFNLLLMFDPNVRFAQEDGNSLLHLAALNYSLEIAETLLSFKQDLYLTNNRGETVFHLASIGPHKLLHKKSTIPLVNIIHNEEVQKFRKSEHERKKVARINSIEIKKQKKAMNPETPSMSQLRFRDNGVFVATSDNVEIPFDDYLAEPEHDLDADLEEIYEIILDSMSDPYFDKLYHELEVRHDKLMSIFMTLPHDINITDIDGNTALHICSKNINFSNHVKFLLEDGANVNFANKEGKTPLHYAIPLRCYSELLFFGADVNIFDNMSVSPFEVAVHSGSLLAIEAILDVCEQPLLDLSHLDKVYNEAQPLFSYMPELEAVLIKYTKQA